MIFEPIDYPQLPKCKLVVWQQILTLLVLTTWTYAAEVQLETDAASKNYADELPRIPPTEPKDALAKFQLADGFRIELAAHEPVVTDPISMAFDERGRLFVVCMSGYSEDADDNLGVVRMLEDTDNDGYFERATDYATGLSWPTAVACLDGGILVAAAPDILYYRDTDGDGVADEQRVVFTGFARNNVQGMLNSFRWGQDTRLYGAAGTNGGGVAKPGAKRTIALRNRDFSIDPTTMSLRSESGGAQHGMTFDRWGERFVCSNSDHLQWIEFDEHHLGRNTLLRGYRSRNSIAVDGPSAEVFRTSPVEPWRIVRTRLRVKGMVSGPVEGGGRAAGYFTSASGVTAYLGDAFPQRYQDDDFIFVGDVGSNLVHLKRIETDLLSKTAVRATPPKTEFLTSTDNWFRPVQFANGPDGALYVLDMYREVIEHPLSLPPMIKQHLDLTSGRTRGRIYRIVPKDWTASERKLPASASDSELVAMLGHPNGWHRETASRLIATRGGKSIETRDRFALLLRDADKASSPYARIRALYCLQAINRLAEPTLVAQLQDEHPQVRRHALKIAELAKHIGEATTSQLESMVDDEDTLVRYQLALTLGRFDGDIRRRLLTDLALRSSNNPKMHFAVLSSMGDDRLEMLKSLLATSDQPGIHELLDKIARQIGRSQKDMAAALKLANSQPRPTRLSLVASLLAGTGKTGTGLVDWLTNQNVGRAKQVVEEVLRSAQQRAVDSTLPIDERVIGVRLLGLGEFATVSATFQALLSPKQPASIRDAAVEELGSFQTVAAAETLIRYVSSLSPIGRRRAFDSLIARPSWAASLLDSVARGDTASNQITAAYRNRLLHHRDPKVVRRAKTLLGAEVDRAKVVADFEGLLASEGSVEQGRKLFQKVCASCHRLDNQGSDVGPDLQPLRNRGAAYILVNILDPNREVDPRYEAYSLVTSDGRTISGLLVSDSATTIELRQADNSVVSLPKDDIELFQATGRSLMPEGLERDLDRQGVADVIAYLVGGDDG